MKKIAAIMLLGVLFASCEKGNDEDESTACYECEMSVTMTIPGEDLLTSTTTTDQCGLTASQAAQFEKSGTTTTTSTSGGLVATSKTVTKCTKK